MVTQREFMKAIGKQIEGMGSAMNDIKMVISMKVNLKKIKLMEKEFIIGKMEKGMMANGRKVKKLVMVFGQADMVILI